MFNVMKTIKDNVNDCHFLTLTLEPNKEVAKLSDIIIQIPKVSEDNDFSIVPVFAAFLPYIDYIIKKYTDNKIDEVYKKIEIRKQIRTMIK
jgi:DNA-binding MurR/RpiR family transcriptional regulator